MIFFTPDFPSEVNLMIYIPTAKLVRFNLFSILLILDVITDLPKKSNISTDPSDISLGDFTVK